LLTEEIRLGLSGDNSTLRAEFNQRRIDETRRLLTLQREVEVTFEGIVEISGNAHAVVAGLTIVLTEEIPGQEYLVPGARVAVRAVTTARGELAARSIRLLAPPVEEVPTVT